MGRLLATAALVSLPCSGAAEEIDRLVLALETAGHVPGDIEALERGTESISLGAMQPILHEVAFAFGIGVSELVSELVMRVGYGFASGGLPAGSEIDNVEASGYAVRSIPITIGWRMAVAPYWIRLLLGVDLGGQVASARYDRPGNARTESGWSWRFGGRGIIGAHADVWRFIGVRLFAEGRFSQGIVVDKGPDIGMSLLGIGLAVVITPERPEPGTLTTVPSSEEEEDTEPLLRDFDEAGASRLNRASAIIRDADEAVKRRDFIAAEKLYRKGVRHLPRDPQTRRNLEVPVRVDWAKVLVEIGRSEDAREVLEEALRIHPEDAAARELLDHLGGPRKKEPTGLIELDGSP